MTNEKRLYLRRLKSGKFINRKVCKACGGQCCKAASCMLMPYDIDPYTSNQIISLINKELLSIEVFFKPGKTIPYLAIREKGHDVFSILTSHSTCSMLGENGCKLSPGERPLGALAMIPSAKSFPDCASTIPISEIVSAWDAPENACIMLEVIRHYSPEKAIENIVFEKFQQFEDELLSNTCRLNKTDKYLVYQSGMVLGYKFKKNVRDLVFM